ncbi:MAG: FtsX-like permease family protein, partial [Rikenellaceae bacterium]
NRDLNDSEQIYRLDAPHPFAADKQDLYIARTSRPIGEAVREQLPQVEQHATLSAYQTNNLTLVRGNGEHVEIDYDIKSATSGIVSLLGLEVISGDVEPFNIAQENNIIISQSAAQRYGIEIGDTIKSATPKEATFTVVAIYKDLPRRSVFADMDMLSNMGDKAISDIDMSLTTNYYKLQKGVDIVALESTAQDIVKEVYKKFGKEEITEKNYGVRFMPLTKSRLAKDMDDNYAGSGLAKRNVIYILTLIAAVIVVIAFINFINFFFALVPIRIRAVNARKILGASRNGLIVSFVAEALGLYACGLVISVAIILGVQDGFIAEYFKTSVVLADNIDLMLLLALFGAVASVVVALYPALYITSFAAEMVVKGSFASSARGKFLRNALIGVQFITSIILFIVAIFMQSQYHYMLSYDMGVNFKDSYYTYVSPSIRGDETLREAFNTKLRECNDIESFTYTMGVIPSRMGSSVSIDVDSVRVECNMNMVEPSVFGFFGVELLNGKKIADDGSSNYGEGFFINETAMRILGKDERYMEVGGDAEFLGVFKDFNFTSLSKEIAPLFFYFQPKYAFASKVLSYRLREGVDPAVVEHYIRDAQAQFDSSDSAKYMEFEPISEHVAAMYGDERKQSRLILIFTLVSMIISLMGVFGLVLFETQFRQQEIVIRRVHGATVREILLMINRKFLIIIAICFVVAAPISYYIVDNWLSTFAYHIPIAAWVFVAVLAVVTLVTTAIVTVQSLKAANSNPAELIGKNS